MKKHVLAFLIIFCFICGGCAKPTPPPPEPEYDAPPTHSGATVSVNGTSLQLFTKDGTDYFSVLALTKLLGGNLQTPPDSAAPYSCDFSLQGALYHLSTDSTKLTTGEQESELGARPLFDGKDWFIPCEAYLKSLPYHIYTDEALQCTYYTPYPEQQDVPAGKRLPILMYHAVGDTPWGIEDLFVTPANLEAQLQYLEQNGYTTVTFEDLDKLDTIQKPVMLTFDDGYEDNYRLLLPLLKKYNAKATVFVITGEIGKPYYLTKEQIKQMSDSGHISIQSHTVTHPYLSNLTEEQLETELSGSKKTLASITGKEPFVICYPTGKHSSLARKKAAEHYRFGLLMNGGTWTTGGDTFLITRSYISRYTSLSSFKAKL